MSKMEMNFINLMNKKDIAININHKGVDVSFNMKPLLTRVSKELLGDQKQFKLLIDYWTFTNNIEYVMDLYKKVEEIIMLDLSGKPSKQYKEYLYKILDTIDYDIAVKFITEHNEVTAPSKLGDVFNELIVSDARGNRVKTYLKSEYYELIVLVMASKAIVGPLCELASINKQSVISSQVAFSLIRYIEDHPIFNTPSAIKLKGFVDSNTYNKKNEDGLSVLSYRKKVSVDELGSFVFSQIFLKSFCSVIPENDTNAKHTVNLAYSALNNLLNKANAVRENVTVKKLRNDEDDKESVFETYRESTDLMLGQVVEFEHVLSEPHKLLKTILDMEGMHEVLDHALVFLEPLKTDKINRSIELITSWVLHDALDSRSILYVKTEYFVNAIAVAFTYLWMRGHRDVARMLTIFKIKDEGFAISFSANKIGLKKDAIIRMNELFTVKEELHSKTQKEEKNSVAITIEKTVSFMYVGSYKYLVNNEYLDGLPRNVEVNSDIRNLLAEVIVDINQ